MLGSFLSISMLVLHYRIKLISFQTFMFKLLRTNGALREGKLNDMLTPAYSLHTTKYPTQLGESCHICSQHTTSSAPVLSRSSSMSYINSKKFQPNTLKELTLTITTSIKPPLCKPAAHLIFNCKILVALMKAQKSSLIPVNTCICLNRVTVEQYVKFLKVAQPSMCTCLYPFTFKGIGKKKKKAITSNYNTIINSFLEVYQKVFTYEGRNENTIILAYH